MPVKLSVFIVALLLSALAVAATHGLVSSSTGQEVDGDDRYVQPPSQDDKCYVMQNKIWIEVTCE